MTLNSLNGTECSTEIIKKINDIIAQKATISLSNLDSAGEQRFTTLAQGISDANDLITALTTVVGTKLSAEVSLQQNGYIKFSNLVCLCWGGGRTGANNTTFVNFPVTYSDSVRITAVSVDNDNSIVGINTHGVSFNGFYAHCKDSSNRFWAQSFNYIAIGY